MRMTRHVSDSSKRFRRAKPAKHHGRLDSGPKPSLKRAVNVSVDTEILEAAKSLHVNLSQTLEDALRKLTEDERIRRWQDENRAAIDSYNAFMKRNGTMSEAVLDLDDPSV